MQAKLEEERNLNASYSRRPFKISSTFSIQPAVPFDFGVEKKKENGILTNKETGEKGEGDETMSEDEEELLNMEEDNNGQSIHKRVILLQTGELSTNM